jgi:myo-inositol-1(or 4)-monophosphatase
MNAPSPAQLVEVAREVGAEAAKVLLEGYRSRPHANEKAAKDLVTEFDLKSEALIRELLSQKTPGIPVVGEERGGTPSGLTWFCDPLDGTMNYVHGHPIFCVSIGAIDEHGPVAGAVIAPVIGIDWWGGRGLGAFRNGVPCTVSSTAALRSSLLGTGFPLDRSKTPENNLVAFATVIQEVQGIRRCGSAAIDCCFVADGTYDAYWERELHVWDVAGGAAIALAAGATLTSLSGGAPDLSRGHIVLSNGKIHDDLVRVLDERAQAT